MPKHLSLSSRELICTLVVALTAWVGTSSLMAAPEPAVVSPSWSLDFELGHPQPISVTTVQGDVRWYWFVPFEVVNRTDRDRLFVPEATVATDAGDIVTANQGVPPSVYRAIEQELGNPYLERPVEVIGTLRQGEDFARESVIVWPAFEHDVDEVRLFISGLSGETKTAINPMTAEPILLRRTRMLIYDSPGNPQRPQDQPMILRESTDVMR